jgi:uncharacterized protein (DUF433 family)
MPDRPYVECQGEVSRVAGIRVALGSIVRCFWEGNTLESIVQSFPVLTLKKVYGAIAYYLRHQECINMYLKPAVAKCETQGRRCERVYSGWESLVSYALAQQP